MVTFKKKEIISPNLKVILEIELNNSSLTPQEAVDRIQFAIDDHHNKSISEFILFLIRETKSSGYEIKKLSID